MAKYLHFIGIKSTVFFYFLRFYLFIHKRHTERCRDRWREKQAPCGEPNVGLNPRTPGSRPEPKADTQPLSHPGAPYGKLSYAKTKFRLIHLKSARIN